MQPQLFRQERSPQHGGKLRPVAPLRGRAHLALGGLGQVPHVTSQAGLRQEEEEDAQPGRGEPGGPRTGDRVSAESSSAPEPGQQFCRLTAVRAFFYRQMTDVFAFRTAHEKLLSHFLLWRLIFLSFFKFVTFFRVCFFLLLNFPPKIFTFLSFILAGKVVPFGIYEFVLFIVFFWVLSLIVKNPLPSK